MTQVTAVRNGAGVKCQPRPGEEQATVTVDETSLLSTYDGLPHAVRTMTDPPDAIVSFDYVDESGRRVNGAPVDAGSYVLATGKCAPGSVSGTLVIEPTPLVVRAADTSRVYGRAEPSLTTEVTGEAVTDVIEAHFVTSATELSPVGTYPIELALTDPRGPSRLSPDAAARHPHDHARVPDGHRRRCDPRRRLISRGARGNGGRTRLD